jgi:hypothetical protein
MSNIFKKARGSPIKILKASTKKPRLTDYSSIIKPAKLKLEHDENIKHVKVDPGDFTSIVATSPLVPKLKRKYESLQGGENDEGANENGNENNTPSNKQHYLMKRIQPQEWYSSPKTLLRGGRGKRGLDSTEIDGQLGSGIVNYSSPPVSWIVI